MGEFFFSRRRIAGLGVRPQRSDGRDIRVAFSGFVLLARQKKGLPCRGHISVSAAQQTNRTAGPTKNPQTKSPDCTRFTPFAVHAGASDPFKSIARVASSMT